jgi:hypothetical protein
MRATRARRQIMWPSSRRPSQLHHASQLGIRDGRGQQFGELREARFSIG